MKPAALLLAGLLASAALPAAAADGTEPAVAVGLPYCPPPPDSTNTFRVLYCGLAHGIPKSADQFLENMTTGPVNAREVRDQALLLAERARGCLDGDYPPCPKMLALPE